MLLVLHTPGFAPDYLRATAAALDDQPIFIDYARDGDVDRWVAQAESLRVRAGVDSWRLFGHGLGGMVAQAYAAQHPSRVERLVLCSTAPSLSWAGARLSQVRHALERGSDEEFRRTCLDVLPLAFAQPFVTEDLHHLFAALRFCRRTFLNALSSVGPSGPVAVKTLIVHGRLDRLIWLECGGEELLDELHDAELLVFEKSGHFPFLEQTGSFFIAVDEFLTGTAEAAAPLYA